MGCAWLAERLADGWTRGHEATIFNCRQMLIHSSFDMHVNLAAVHFGRRLALHGRSLHRAFRLCLGYHCTVVLPFINLQWDAERFVDTALQNNESKNNCNASMRGLQSMPGLQASFGPMRSCFQSGCQFLDMCSLNYCRKEWFFHQFCIKNWRTSISESHHTWTLFKTCNFLLWQGLIN